MDRVSLMASRPPSDVRGINEAASIAGVGRQASRALGLRNGSKPYGGDAAKPRLHLREPDPTEGRRRYAAGRSRNKHF